MVRTNLQEFGGDVHVLSNLQVGSNLFANDLAANVLSIAGNVAAEYFIGDGGFLSNIATTLNEIVANPDGNSVSNTVVFISGQDPIANTAIVTYANVGISVSNTNPSGEYQLSIGSNIFVNTHASNVLTIIGSVGANTFIGDGGLLSNIATTIDQIIDQGNTVSNTLQLISGVDATSNIGLVTHKDVGISVSNVNPTGEFQFGVGSNLFVNTYSSNVLSIEGNVNAQKMTLGTIAVTSAYGLNHVTAQGSATGDTISLTNATTGLSADSNIVVGGNVTAQTVITSANVEVGDRLKFASNVFVDDLRIADLAANLVTYDKTTGELMDSGGLFANKLAVVSVQPPSALSANVTTVAKHGTYTLTTSGLLAGSNTWNAFDGAAAEWTSVGPYDAGGGVYSGTSNLFAGSAGDWLAIEFPYKTTLRHMKLTPPAIVASYPASANIYATNDSLTWTEVAQWEDADPVTSSNVQTIIVNASESYKRYAMVATKSNGSTSNVALGEWKLFAESFSIDGGQISMAQQPVTGGETMMEQSGPHSRGEAKLKKYPEIVFDGKIGDFVSIPEKGHHNQTSNTYTIGGYEVVASSEYTHSSSRLSAWKLFDSGLTEGEYSGWGLAETFNAYNAANPAEYPSSGTARLATTDVDGNSIETGGWIYIKLPNKIRLKSYALKPWGIANRYGVADYPKEFYIYASNDGTNWKLINSQPDAQTPSILGSTASSQETISYDVSQTGLGYYSYYAMTIRRINSVAVQAVQSDITPLYMIIGDWKLYGYEEDPPLGDTSVDTTFTSIMNTPQTTGAQVYVDGNLGETFTNRVTGPTVSNTHTTYVSAEKYWELSGNVESNVTLEANTFLSGDAPHSLSMWFNSSNLEANVSNSCIFSLATEEKLDSVNLDLQSNTWHNLTYAYQGEGGSRVTYLDGRKVAEDQAEDTFGKYPPFVMAGYSQGGYVASFSRAHDGVAWHMWGFDETSTGDQYGWTTPFAIGGGGVSSFEVSSGDVRDGGPGIPNLTGTYQGEYAKLELPYKLVLSSIMIRARAGETRSTPREFKVFGSNDDVNWVEILSETGAVPSESADTSFYSAGVQDRGYKYLGLVVNKIQPNNTNGQLSLRTLKLYGHRENDLVRLPDPTNVLKYPHINSGISTATAVSYPAVSGINGLFGVHSIRGYVFKASSSIASYPVSSAFNGDTSSITGSRWASGATTYGTGGVYPNSGLAANRIRTLSSDLGGPVEGATGGTVKGEWLYIEMPYKVKATSMKIVSHPYVGEQPKNIIIYGSNDLTAGWTIVDNTYVSTSIAVPLNATGKTWTVSTASNPVAYKYFALVTTKTDYTGGVVGLVVINDWQLYGTGVDSIPLQIGGGNIDKVANFRVYDKFVGEDQALEIWDAQKDEFGRAKSSMTLQKGRLGIGTTEPQGRLAVADEPHNLEEFPPRAMTGYKTYFEGHGEFCASASDEHSSDYDVQNAFNKITNRLNSSGGTTNTYYNGGEPTPRYYDSGNDYAYSGTSSTHGLGGVMGEWVKLEFPYKANISQISILPVDIQISTLAPEDFTIMGSSDDINWTTLRTVTGATWTAHNFNEYTLPSTISYKYFALVVSRTVGANQLSIQELRYFGTREQGQSVLHDGQLTLTKSLNVPRIGPALDADDTPRRDRLVVEYNTSTNPTFEGAVRDTSGRGNDGVMYGTAAYNSTSKDLYFDGNSDFIETDLGKEVFKNSSIHTTSLWVKMNHHDASQQILFSLGQGAGANLGHVNLYYTDNFGLRLSFEQHDYRLGEVVPIGQWVHVAYTYDGTTWQNTTTPTNVNIYINGVKVGITSVYEIAGGGGSALDLSVAQLALGAASTNATGRYYTDADLSQFKLYDTALTAEEVKTLYDMGRCDEGHHVVNFSKTRVGIGLGDGEAPTAALDVRGENVVFNPQYESGTSSGRVGIGTSSPNSAFNFHQGTVFNGGAVPFGGSFSMTAYNPTGTVENVFSLFINSNNDLILGYGYNYDGNLSGTVGYFTDQNTDDHLNNFTGQHRTFIKDVPFSQVGELEGLIVSSDQNKYIKMSGGIEAGSNAITTNESLPIVSLSATASDKRCFGVISASEDPEERSDAFGSFVTPYEKEKGDTRVYINSVGEGAIWVSNIGGNLEAGDYITTSNVAGYGQKQDDDILHNYTVAKITMDCDFNPATQPVQQILRSNVIQTYYLGDVHKVKSVPHEFVTTTVGADDTWSNVSVSPSDVTYAEWSNLEANTQNTYNLTYTQTSNVVYDTKYTLTTTANVTESDPWDSVFVDPPDVTYAQYSNLEANTQSSYSLTFTKTTTDEKTPDEWSALESNTQSLYNMVYYQSVEEEVASDYPGAVAHTRVTDVIENELDAHGQIQWEDHATETEKAYKIRYLDVSGAQTDSANAVHIAAFVGCTYHCG
jgi:hypothetical protein